MVQKSEATPTIEADYLRTYFAYDDKGNLRVVFPPLLVEVQSLTTTVSWNPSINALNTQSVVGIRRQL